MSSSTVSVHYFFIFPLVFSLDVSPPSLKHASLSRYCYLCIICFFKTFCLVSFCVLYFLLFTSLYSGSLFSFHSVLYPMSYPLLISLSPIFITPSSHLTRLPPSCTLTGLALRLNYAGKIISLVTDNISTPH